MGSTFTTIRLRGTLFDLAIFRDPDVTQSCSLRLQEIGSMNSERANYCFVVYKALSDKSRVAKGNHGWWIITSSLTLPGLAGLGPLLTRLTVTLLARCSLTSLSGCPD